MVINHQIKSISSINSILELITFLKMDSYHDGFDDPFNNKLIVRNHNYCS